MRYVGRLIRTRIAHGETGVSEGISVGTGGSVAVFTGGSVAVSVGGINTIVSVGMMVGITTIGVGVEASGAQGGT